MKNNKLSFSKGNKKLPKTTAIFSLVAGHTCLGAKDCLAKVNLESGKVEDSKEMKFRCFAASLEAAFPSVLKSHLRNFELIKSGSIEDKARLILDSLPKKGIDKVRIHASGDFFSLAYLLAWVKVAKTRQDLTFYGYTKALPLLVGLVLPSNFLLVASKGGKFDDLIEKHSLQFAEVVENKEQAENLGLEVDKNDELAWDSSRKSFALVIHGTQPKGRKSLD